MKMNRKPSCGMCCCGVVLLLCLICIVGRYVATEIAESAIFLKTENIMLTETGDAFPYYLQNDPRTACFWKEVNRTAVYPQSHYGTIPLRESDDFLVFVEKRRRCACFICVNVDPRTRFQNESHFTFYRIHRKESQNKSCEVKTEYLGFIDTNRYGAWREKSNRISISPDGKYIVMSAHTVDSRSQKFRDKNVLLIWEIGDNVVEKDIVDEKGNKIPIIIKTDEELEKR